MVSEPRHAIRSLREGHHELLVHLQELGGRTQPARDDLRLERSLGSLEDRQRIGIPRSSVEHVHRPRQLTPRSGGCRRGEQQREEQNRELENLRQTHLVRCIVSRRSDGSRPRVDWGR